MRMILKWRRNAFILSIFTIFTISIFSFSDRLMLLVEAHNLIPYSINWTNTNLITTDNVWIENAELVVRGYSGADIAAAPGTDARTVLAESLILNVKANQTNPDTLVEGGVAEFEIANPTVALKGSDTARAPYIIVLLRTTGFSNIRFRANARDLSTVNDAVQQVAVQYRLATTGPFTDVPSAYIADATEGGTATQVTPIDVILPAEANNIAPLEIRVMTVNAVGNDEWIGIDDISVTGVTSAPRRVFDFDGDGRSDVSVFRPSNGVWYLLNSNTGFASVQFGISTDKIVPADYDNDGKTDVAVYRPSNGTWYLNRSLAGFTAIGFGTAEDIPQPSDFDGDGEAELAVFRPSNGTWYVLNLVTNQFSFEQFGQTGDRPVAADYDGDGRADYAVYRNGEWYILRSNQGFIGIQFGETADKPVPADYDGDGQADVAVFRPSNGTWYLNRSMAGFAGMQFGISADIPAPADYDGDGKADLAVFRDGEWYLLQSTAGVTGIAFGATTDRPVPNAFVP